VIIYDGCQSGSFLPYLTAATGERRVVITSTSPEESAYFVSQGSVSFSNSFWTHIFNGHSIHEAFLLSAESIGGEATAYQTPILDDNGNGIGNDGSDGMLAASLYIGNGNEVQGEAPVIGRVFSEPSSPAHAEILLYAETVTDADGIARVWAVIRPPDYHHAGSNNPVQELPFVDLMPSSDQKNLYVGSCDSFNLSGTYYISVYAQDRAGNTSAPKQISVNTSLTRKAVIVAGSSQHSSLVSAIENNALLAYETLRYQGYADDDIYLMLPAGTSAGFDAQPSLETLKHVLTSWAAYEAHDCVVYLVGDGSLGHVVLNDTETLTAEDLNAWLTTLEKSLAGNVTVIYDACRSGSFIPILSAGSERCQRIVITGSAADQSASFLCEGALSFSNYFWRHVLYGADVGESFIHARQAISLSGLGQMPAIDSNGNGIANEKEDNQQARNVTLGFGILLAEDPPILGSVCPPQTLSGSPAATLWVDKVSATGAIRNVWAVIIPPDHHIHDPSQPIIDLPTIALNDDGTGRYVIRYNEFTTPGMYLCLSAQDTDGTVSVPKTTTVNQRSAPAGGSITGRVIDQETGTCIARALVTAYPWGYQTITDDYGYFTLDELPPGAYSLSIDTAGYHVTLIDYIGVTASGAGCHGETLEALMRPVAGGSADGFECDDMPHQAKRITLDGSDLTPPHIHNFHHPDDVDMAVFYVAEQQNDRNIYQIETTGLGSRCDTVITLYDHAMQLIAGPIDDFGTGESEALPCILAEGAYYIAVSGASENSYGEDTQYEIHVWEPTAPLGSIMGTVKDRLTGEPIHLAKIITDTGGVSYSHHGIYHIPGIPTGTCTMSASKHGYQTEKIPSVSIGEGAENNLNFTLMPEADLYFPYVSCKNGWNTTITIVNTSETDSLIGELQAYNQTGERSSEEVSVFLPPHGKAEYPLCAVFIEPHSPSYVIFSTDAHHAAGYIEYGIEETNRAALSAVRNTHNSGSLYLPHIVSSEEWQTEVSLLNTTDDHIDICMEFDVLDDSDAVFRTTTSIARRSRMKFTVADLFEGQKQPTIVSGRMAGTDGVIGLVFFSNADQLIAASLSDQTAGRIFCPHVLNNENWATGLVVYNPSHDPCVLTISAYDAASNILEPITESIDGHNKFTVMTYGLSLPDAAAWLSIDGSKSITGFQALVSRQHDKADGRSILETGSKTGLLPLAPNGGWCAFGLVNIAELDATIVLTAYNDSGIMVARETLEIPRYGKITAFPCRIFKEQLSDATYLTYSSNTSITAFQLNSVWNSPALAGIEALPTGEGPVTDAAQN